MLPLIICLYEAEKTDNQHKHKGGKRLHCIEGKLRATALMEELCGCRLRDGKKNNAEIKQIRHYL